MNSYMSTFTDEQLRARLVTYTEMTTYNFVTRGDTPQWRKDAIADGVAVVRREMERRGLS